MAVAHRLRVCVCVQVSEVYSLHRQTAYLAQDFFDRFMLTQEDVSKEHLQLLGITALFIASKMEVSEETRRRRRCAGSSPDPGTFCSAGNLPPQDLRVCLRDGRRLRHVGHPADGAAHAEGEGGRGRGGRRRRLWAELSVCSCGVRRRWSGTCVRRRPCPG